MSQNSLKSVKKKQHFYEIFHVFSLLKEQREFGDRKLSVAGIVGAERL